MRTFFVTKEYFEAKITAQRNNILKLEFLLHFCTFKFLLLLINRTPQQRSRNDPYNPYILQLHYTTVFFVAPTISLEHACGINNTSENVLLL